MIVQSSSIADLERFEGTIFRLGEQKLVKNNQDN